jgi:hypothetical protein
MGESNYATTSRTAWCRPRAIIFPPAPSFFAAFVNFCGYFNWRNASLPVATFPFAVKDNGVYSEFIVDNVTQRVIVKSSL